MSVIGNVGGSDGLTNDQLRAAPIEISAPSAIPISAASAIPVSGAGGAVVLDAFSNKWIKFSSKNSPYPA